MVLSSTSTLPKRKYSKVIHSRVVKRRGYLFPSNLETVESYTVEIFKNVSRTNKQLVGQYIYFSDLKPENLWLLKKTGLLLSPQRDLNLLKSKKPATSWWVKTLYIQRQKPVCFFIYLWPSDRKYLTESVMDSIINSIEINGTKSIWKNQQHRQKRRSWRYFTGRSQLYQENDCKRKWGTA